MKIYCADFRTESNIFSPLPTSYKDFEHCIMMRGGDTSGHFEGFRPVIGRFQELAKTKGFDIVMGLETIAAASGRIVRRDYERIRDEILDELKAAMPVDTIMLQLHGAMAASGYDDCEGDILVRIRDIVGPDVPVGVELDPHCHLTEAMVANANVMVFYKEQPHDDHIERADEIFEMCVATAEGRIKPVSSVFNCRMLNNYHTTIEPMKSFVDKIKGLEGQNDVLSISIVHGYPLADNPDVGVKVLVLTDNRKEYGDKLAEELGMELFGMREATFPRMMNADQAIDATITMDDGDGQPVIMADFADQVGGGAPGDSTFLLSALMERNVQDVIFGFLWDPFAVDIAHKVGEGEQLEMRIGGRLGPVAGPPLDVMATVIRVVTANEAAAMDIPMTGDIAVIRVGSIDVVLTSERASARPFENFESLGLNPKSRKVLVIKSAYPHHPEYPKGLMVTTPGAINVDIGSLQYKNIRRPIWPLDPDPFANP